MCKGSRGSYELCGHNPAAVRLFQNRGVMWRWGFAGMETSDKLHRIGEIYVIVKSLLGKTSLVLELQTPEVSDAKE